MMTDESPTKFALPKNRRDLSNLDDLLAGVIAPPELSESTRETSSGTQDRPARFQDLDRLVNRLRAEVQERIYDTVAERLTNADLVGLDTLLIVPPDAVTTPFNRLKQAPGPATFNTIKLWTERLQWLGRLTSPDALLKGITHTKQCQFAAEAAA